MQRSITLPSAVSSENAEARIENGVLSLRLPKAAGRHAAPDQRFVRLRRRERLNGGIGPDSLTSDSGHGARERDRTAEGDRVTEESQESFPGQRSAVVDAGEELRAASHRYLAA